MKLFFLVGLLLIIACTTTQNQYSSLQFKMAQEKSKEFGSTAVVVLHNGKTIAEWGDVERPLNIYSIRKSLISALFGIYTQKGNIYLDSSLEDHDIDDTEPKLTTEEKKAKVRDLLKSRSGVYHLAAYETELMREKRPERGSHKPGTFWYYNNWDFNVLATIFKKTTGLTVFEAFEKDLAIPLGLQDFTISDTKWRFDPVSKHPAYKFKLSARDLARFGQLYLNKGQWNGVQIIPLGWIEESIKPYSDAKPGVGYGYMWWVAKGFMQFGKDMGEKIYSARGNKGQYLLIFPDKNLVIAHLTEKEITAEKFGEIVSEILRNVR
jgi:CubicO group peptidase (beta-lactamase class C family)